LHPSESSHTVSGTKRTPDRAPAILSAKIPTDTQTHFLTPTICPFVYRFP
jgi:hypothetical protein